MFSTSKIEMLGIRSMLPKIIHTSNLGALNIIDHRENVFVILTVPASK